MLQLMRWGLPHRSHWGTPLRTRVHHRSAHIVITHIHTKNNSNNDQSQGLPIINSKTEPDQRMLLRFGRIEYLLDRPIFLENGVGHSKKNGYGVQLPMSHLPTPIMFHYELHSLNQLRRRRASANQRH